MRLLIADDDKLLQALLVAMLKDHDFEVSVVNDGAEAWDVLQRQHHPIVLTDWAMPHLSGLELIQRIRNHPDDEYTYIIVLTGRLDRQSFRDGMAAGADDFLTKPCSAEEIDARLTVARRIMTLQHQLAQTNRTLRRSNRELKFFKERVQQELSAAARVQESLLPSNVPQLPGLSIHWKVQPTVELAGDVLNVFMLDTNHLALYVLDVSGHGVSAALLSAQLSRLLSPVPTQSQLLMSRRNGDTPAELASPVEVLSELNRLFPMNPDAPQFFTLVYGVLDIRSGVLRYATAGHPGPIVARHDGQTSALEVAGTPIGLIPFGSWSEREIQLETGDLLVLYSDGVVEAMDSSGQMFGEERLVNLIGEAAAAEIPLTDLCDQILANIDTWNADWPHNDDRTLLTLRLDSGTAQE